MSRCKECRANCTSAISFLYFHRLQAYFFTTSISRNTESVSNTELHEASKEQNMRKTLFRPPTYDVKIQFHPSTVLPPFLLLISNFIQASPSLFLSPLRPYDIQTNTRGKNQVQVLPLVKKKKKSRCKFIQSNLFPFLARKFLWYTQFVSLVRTDTNCHKH
jgi:hypothetical protein